ncbi:uncharacterized protein LOC129720496 [Wyeomyia smithii]|uniref:uncharacterized protein LOC129720496 n=1 Tax=Wyeomyia smithii TaxID=174621 RepID=UPI002467AD69|nr:uncharacterized protein LOC129720496 [Wyeomyia smithii]
MLRKNRLYPRYSLNSSDNEDTPIHRSIYAQPYNSQLTPQLQCNIPVLGGGQSNSYSANSGYRSVKGSASSSSSTHAPHQTTTTPSSDNGSSATLTDAELALVRENTLLVNNGKHRL